MDHVDADRLVDSVAAYVTALRRATEDARADALDVSSSKNADAVVATRLDLYRCLMEQGWVPSASQRRSIEAEARRLARPRGVLSG